MKSINLFSVEQLVAANPDGTQTNLVPFDAATGGLRPGKLYLLGAATGVGKTSVMIGLGCALAKQGHKVLYIGTEDDTETIVGKMVANLCGVQVRANMTDDDKAAVANTLAVYGNCLAVDRYEDLNYNLAGAVEQAAEQGYEYVFYDYLGAIAANTDREWRQLETLTDQLKRLAVRLKVCFFTAVQLSITVKTDKELPEFVDERYLANSKGIARKADVAFNILRKTENNPTTLEFHMYKNRCGARAKFELQMDYSRSLLYTNDTHKKLF